MRVCLTCGNEQDSGEHCGKCGRMTVQSPPKQKPKPAKEQKEGSK